MEQDGSRLDQGDGLMQSPNITPLGDDIQLGLMGSFSRGVKNQNPVEDIKKTIEFFV